MKLKREYTIALTIIAGIILLVFGVNYLKGLDLLQKRNLYHVVYNDISGVTGASPLFYKGLKVGQVVRTELLPDGSGRIAVTFQVNEDRLRIPKDSRIQLYSADLFTRAAQLITGKSDVLALEGDTLIGDTQLSLTESVGQQIDPLKHKAEAMIASVDSLLSSLQKVLNTESIGDINASFSSIRHTLSTLDRTMLRVDELVETESQGLHSTLQNVHRLTETLARNSARLDNIFANLDTASSSLAAADLEKVVRDLASTSEQLNEVLTKINTGEGTLGALVNNDSLYNNLNAATAQLDLLLEDLRMNPNRYLSVFGKKDKLPKLSKADIERIQQVINEQAE